MAASSLSELLQKKKQSYEAEATRNREIIDEWVTAVAKLFLQFRAWLAISDSARILQVEHPSLR